MAAQSTNFYPERIPVQGAGRCPHRDHLSSPGQPTGSRRTGPKANHILIRQEVDRLKPPQSSVLPAGEKENDVTKETTAMVNEKGPYPTGSAGAHCSPKNREGGSPQFLRVSETWSENWSENPRMGALFRRLFWRCRGLPTALQRIITVTNYIPLCAHSARLAHQSRIYHVRGLSRTEGNAIQAMQGTFVVTIPHGP